MFLGPPGSGKGSQAKYVIDEYAIDHISTGELLRSAVSEGTSLGNQIADIMQQGGLVPDQIVLQLISDYLDSSDLSKGFLFDGFPRNSNQAEQLQVILAERNVPLLFVLHLQVDPIAVVKRLSGRRNCSNCGRIYNIYFDPPQVEGQCDDCGSTGVLFQRADDNEASIRNRLDVYESETAPLLEYYERAELLVTVDASGDLDEVAEAVRQVIRTELCKS
ncbi:MAG: adenylate kinase [Gammaproteobacteria bacterium]|nr:adenylate kinase [Gammaproteobacteria bacterium]